MSLSVSCTMHLFVILQDFRDAVAKASHQAGKPVIEERNLNQILYYLPQLYELNQDLLKELEERVAQWYFHNLLEVCLHIRNQYQKTIECANFHSKRAFKQYGASLSKVGDRYTMAVVRWQASAKAK